MHPLLNQETITVYQHDGVVLFRRLFADHVDDLRSPGNPNFEGIATQ